MASRPEISLIYDPSPRSSTMPHESSYTGLPTQLDASSKQKKSKSLPTGYGLGLHPTRLGFNGKEVLIWRQSRLNKIFTQLISRLSWLNKIFPLQTWPKSACSKLFEFLNS